MSCAPMHSDEPSTPPDASCRSKRRDSAATGMRKCRGRRVRTYLVGCLESAGKVERERSGIVHVAERIEQYQLERVGIDVEPLRPDDDGALGGGVLADAPDIL